MNHPIRLVQSLTLVTVCLCVFVPPAAGADPALVGRWPYGPASAVDVSGGYAYFGSGGALLVIDISDPTSMAVVGEVVMPGVVNDVVILGGYAYVVSYEAGLFIFDISAPNTPLQVANVALSSGARRVAISDGYVYVADDISGLFVFDVSTPTDPFEVAHISPVFDAITNVVVSGEYAYVIDQDRPIFVGFCSSFLRVIDISTPSAPVDVSMTYVDQSVPDLAISGKYVYAVVYGEKQYGGLCVIDLSDPANPALVGYAGNDFCQAVAVSGGYAYVTDSSRGVEVIDVSDPQNPVEVGSFEDLPWGHAGSGVAVAGGHVFVPAGWNGLRAIDVRTPTSPVNVGFVDTPGSTHDVAVIDGYAYLAAGSLRIIDVSDPPNPVEVASLALPDAAGVVNISDDGNHVYLTSTSVDIRVVDVSDPYTPVELGSVVLGGWARKADVSGGFAYVVFSGSGGLSLQVVDVTDPSYPFGVGELRQGSCWGVAVSGVYAYLACSDLKVVDVSNPSLPVQVGFADIDENCHDVAAREGYAYLACGHSLRVFDVSAPSLPVEVGVLPVPANALAVSGSDTIVLVGGDVISVVNISDPSAPFEVEHHNLLAGTGYGGVAVLGDYSYVAEGRAGMEIFELVAVFTDSFESGDTSAWSLSVP